MGGIHVVRTSPETFSVKVPSRYFTQCSDDAHDKSVHTLHLRLVVQGFGGLKPLLIKKLEDPYSARVTMPLSGRTPSRIQIE